MIAKMGLVGLVLIAALPAAAQEKGKLLCSHKAFAEPEMRGAWLLGKPGGGFSVSFSHSLRAAPGAIPAAGGRINGARDNSIQLGWDGTLDARSGRVAWEPASFTLLLSARNPLLNPATPITLFVEAGGRRFGPYPVATNLLLDGMYFFSAKTTPYHGAQLMPVREMSVLFDTLDRQPSAILVLSQGGREAARVPVASPSVAGSKARVATWAAASVKARAGGACLPGDVSKG